MSPTRAPTPCLVPTCPEAGVVRGRCRRHAAAREAVRGTASARGYGPRWRRRRAVWLRRHPLCARCERAGRLVPATVVDHVVPHRGDPVLFWDESNWQGLCKPHHDRKTAGGL